MSSFRRTAFRILARIVIATGLFPLILLLSDRWRMRARRRFPWLERRERLPYQILVYHRVGESSNPILNSLEAAAFESHARVLARFFHVRPLEQLVSAGHSSPPGAIAITFDDGYRDNYRVAYPILRAHSLPVTIFLTTGAVGTDRRLWHDELAESISETRAERLAWAGAEYPLSSHAQRSEAFYRIRERLLGMEERKKREELARLGDALGADPPGSRERIMLSWEEIRIMAQGGVTFGSHTVTHPILSRIPREEVWEEIRHSRETIERELHGPVRLFAYPNGRGEDFNECVKEILHNEGFVAAVTTIAGTNDSSRDPFELRRQTPHERDGASFALKLAWLRLHAE